jgi:ribosomal protein S18 acetylase RimI-like enzyme
VQVFTATTSLLDSTLQAIQACNSKLRSLGIDQWDDEYPSKEIVAAAISSQTLYLIGKEGSIFGGVGLDTEQPVEYRSCSWRFSMPALVVHHLFIHPAHWRNGLASSLMDFAESHAKNLSVSSIRLDAYTGNEAALSLYRTRGYSYAGEVTFRGRGLVFFCFEKQVE